MESPLQQKAFLLLLAIVTVAFFWVLLPFYGAVFWAVILAILFRPLQTRLARALGHHNLAAFLSVLTCVVIAILPLTIVVLSVAGQIGDLVRHVQSGAFAPPASLSGMFDSLPSWARTAMERAGVSDLADLRNRLAAGLSQAAQLVASQALSATQNTLRFAASVGIMLYVLFFLFRDGPQIGRAIRTSLPLSPEVSRALLAKFTAVIRATVKGNIIIALLQGGIGGVAFWALGIPGALLWGVLMVFMSMLPAVGSAIVWAPVAGYLLLTGDLLRGGILIAIGVGVISLVDNLLRPPLVGKETRLPDYVVLVSTLGGLAIFGLNGFVIGPLIAALFVVSWTLFRDEHAGGDGGAT